MDVPPTIMSTSLASSLPSVEELLRENTALRARLQLSDEQRVMQAVLTEQLQRFFRCVADQEQSSQAVLRVPAADLNEEQRQAESVAAEEEAGAAAQTAASSLSTAVSSVLRHMQTEKARTEATLERLQTDTIAPLHGQVATLQQEKQQLLQKVKELEMSMASTPAPPLVAELKQLRSAEALLLQQLQEAQQTSANSVGSFHKSMEDGLTAVSEVPELIERLHAFKEEVRSSHYLQAAQRLLLEELERRHVVEREIAAAFHAEEANMLRERLTHLEVTVKTSSARESALVAQLEAKEAQLLLAQKHIQELVRQHSEEQLALAQKRQRAEQDASSNPSSIRGEMTKFWYEGRDRIRELERQVRTLHLVEADLRVSQGRVAQLEQRKAALTSNLAALATEIDRRRDEERRLRAHCAGLEAERDRLLSSVASTVAPVLPENELRACCSTIREAATRAAAASATVVADPRAIEDALRRSQKLKSEVAQLQRHKDQLQRFVELREDRVRALLEQEAFLRTHRESSEGDTASALHSTSSNSNAFSLVQFLEQLRQGANDIFMQNELAAARVVASGEDRKGGNPHRSATPVAQTSTDNGVMPHRSSFVALQQQYQQSQEKLVASHRELLETRQENRRLHTELETAQQEHANTAKEQKEARHAVERANAALTTRTTTLQHELQELRRHYTALVEMVRLTLEGLARTLQLYHQSEQHAEKLREMVQEERRDMRNLLQREAASWGSTQTAHTEGTAAVETQHNAAAEKITAALQQMQAYIAEAVARTSLQASQDQTSYIGLLVQAIQQQEERVQAAKTAFEVAAQAQAQSLAERISAAQQQWESTWKAKFQAMESERTQSVMQQHASVVLQRAVEQAVAIPEVDSSASSSLLVPPPEVEEAAMQLSGTLQTIRSFITHARQRQEQLAREQQQQQAEEEQRRQRAEAQAEEEEAAAKAHRAASAAVNVTSPLTPASPAPSLGSSVATPSVPPLPVATAAPSTQSAHEPIVLPPPSAPVNNAEAAPHEKSKEHVAPSGDEQQQYVPSFANAEPAKSEREAKPEETESPAAPLEPSAHENEEAPLTE